MAGRLLRYSFGVFARKAMILVVGLLLTGGPLGPRPARADDGDATVQAARALYDRGEKNFEAGKFVEAGADFEAAYKLTPRSDLLYDAGHAYDRGGSAARAVEMYEAYLRTGDALPEEARVKARLEELRQQVAYLMVHANKDGATVVIDGKERGTTPLRGGVPVLSGLHKIEVRLGNMVWKSEGEFPSGLTHTIEAELRPPPPPEIEEKPAKRFVAVIGLGGVIEVRSTNFPPSQAQLLFGFEYRVLDRRAVAVDVTARVPLEFGQGWTNAAIMPGARLVLYLSKKYGLALVPSLDLGLSLLHLNKNGAPPITATPCGVGLECTLPGLRIHPSLSFVYHFLPDWEVRAELFGLVADITSPIPDPRVSFGVQAAWRFR
jgi:hypothetical protein